MCQEGDIMSRSPGKDDSNNSSSSNTTSGGGGVSSCSGSSSSDIGSSGSSSSSSSSGGGGINGGTDKEEQPSRGLKRALQGVAGASLIAASAALLARSDDIGEWLQSVATNVLPSAEAGAEIVQKAIAEAKKCLKEGANVCLDAEGQATALYTFISQWYLSPKQHVIEMAGSILLLGPLVYLYLRVCRARVRLQRAAGSFNMKRTPFVMKLWGAGLLGHVTVGAAMKFAKNELISHPAYLWQPCHVHSLVVGLCTFRETEGSLLVMHVATTLWWGPFLAFVAPSLPSDPVEIAVFWGQHALLLLVPFFRLLVGGKWMYRDFWWNSVGFLLLACYHWWWLAPVNIVTGVNVATMSVPPDSLEMFGKYYRLVWGVACIVLQFLAVAVMCLLAWVCGQWPSRSAPTPEISAERATGGGTVDGRAGGIPGDAVGISHGEAVALVDGN